MVQRSMLLPRAIRQARQKRKLTQTELARRLGVSQGAISFWERGLETPSLENLVNLVQNMPEIFEQLAQQESDMLARLYRLERAISGNRCNCRGCNCSQ